jgi:hypothetical protein
MDYKGFVGAQNGICRIRIFTNDDDSKFVGICSALPENYTTSTTNVIEHIYADVKSKFFEGSVKQPCLSDEERFSAVEEMAKNIDGKKYFTLAVQALKVLWEQKNKYEKENPSHPPMLWVDHWPKSIGFRPRENDFAFVQFTENLVPHWTHVSEEQFVEYTGIDMRLINELELAE